MKENNVTPGEMPHYVAPHHGLHGLNVLSGRVLDSRPRARGFEPHRRHCVVLE